MITTAKDMRETPERMVLQPCPTYGWRHPDRVKYPVPPATEYVRAEAAEAALERAALRGWMLGREAALEAVTQSLRIGSEAAAIRALVPPADLTAQVKEAGE